MIMKVEIVVLNCQKCNQFLNAFLTIEKTNCNRMDGMDHWVRVGMEQLTVPEMCFPENKSKFRGNH